jgi:hypothetical protein
MTFKDVIKTSKDVFHISFDVFNEEYLSRRYYECSCRRDKNVKCQARLRVKNGNYILNGHHNHAKPIFQLADIKRAIEQSHPGETTRAIKRRIVST